MTSTKTKQCSRKTCLKTKPLDQFPSDKREHDKHSVWCKSCWSEYQAARKALKAAGKPTAVKAVVKTSGKAGKTPAKAVAGKAIAKPSAKKTVASKAVAVKATKEDN